MGQEMQLDKDKSASEPKTKLLEQRLGFCGPACTPSLAVNSMRALGDVDANIAVAIAVVVTVRARCRACTDILALVLAA